MNSYDEFLNFVLGSKGGEQSVTVVEPLSISENGVYTASEGYAFSPVTVDVTSGGGGGITADDIAMRTISGVVSGSASFIAQYAFYQCFSLTAASFPACTHIGASAFQACSSLTAASFPACTHIGASAFQACSSLTAASFPACTYIGTSAFQDCRSLTAVSFPACTSIGSYVFYNCRSLTAASFPACTHIGASAFQDCRSLTAVSFPACTHIGSYVFYNCSSLTAASFPACVSVGASTFRGCYHLESAYFFGTSVPTLGANAFTSTPIGGYSASLGRYGSVFVRESLYSAFITATNWSSIASRIVSMTDAEIEALG